MDYEKKYKEALERAKAYQGLRSEMEIIFHELKESEDEKIKKAVLKAFKIFAEKQAYIGHCLDDIDWDKCIAWLEKQGENEDKDIEIKLSHAHFEGEIEGRDKVLSNPEKYGLQKIAEKVESKFKIGDTITDPTDSRFTFHINTIKDGKYIESDKAYVLVKEADSDYELVEQKSIEDIVSAPMSYSKELEKKMNEACHRFFAPDTDNNRYSASDLFYAGVKAERDLNISAWSEVDAMQLDAAIHIVANSGHTCTSDWLKALKERFTWKPSDEHYELEEFAKIVRGNLTGISKAVQKLFEAKYLQLTGNKMYGGFKD